MLRCNLHVSPQRAVVTHQPNSLNTRTRTHQTGTIQSANEVEIQNERIIKSIQHYITETIKTLLHRILQVIYNKPTSTHSNN